jgi:ABC-type dipeptide/oligopeptide/nickel transport system permease subunit
VTNVPPRVEEDPSYGEIVWGQFWKRPLARAALGGVLLLLAVAIACPLFVSNKPFFCTVDGRTTYPWLLAFFDRNFYESGVDLFFNTLLFPGAFVAIGIAIAWRRTRDRPRAKRRTARRRILALGFGVQALVLVGLLLFPTTRPKEVHVPGQAGCVFPMHPYAPREPDLANVRAPLTREHPLGTDNAGRDVLARLVYGTRISLTIGLFAVSIYVTFGTILGALAGYYGGVVDLVILRAIEVMISIPSIFLILALAAFIENRSIFHIMLIISAVAWTQTARLVRGEFLRLRNLDFVMAARAAGFGEATIIFREILPNALGPVLVNAAFGVASAILTESTISFLGLGDITVPSWGQILNAGRTTSIWPLILAPGLAIFVTVSLLNLAGEGLRDAMDPKLRR